MDHIIVSMLLIFLIDFLIESTPIKSGFSVKFKPLFNKEEVHPRTFGTLFAKISQEFTPEAFLRRELFAKSLPPPPPKLGYGYTNQVARIMKQKENSMYEDFTWNSEHYINLPIIKQPYKDYKILVVTAPPDMNFSRINGDKKVVIYVVFSEDATTTTVSDEARSNMVTVPDVYFVNKPLEHTNIHQRTLGKSDPLIIVNSNRTVTGLRSKQVAKLIKFKNDLLNRFNYELNP